MLCSDWTQARAAEGLASDHLLTKRHTDRSLLAPRCFNDLMSSTALLRVSHNEFLREHVRKPELAAGAEFALFSPVQMLDPV